jgi:flagellar protein FliS
MNTSDPVLSYQQAAARGTTPVGQVVALYDTILRDFARALAAQQAGDIETRVSEINHALLVIAHLQSVLDHERGGEATMRFAQFYNITRGMIVQANFEAGTDSLESLISMYSSLRQAWHQVEPESSANLPAESPRAAAETRNAPSTAPDAETEQLRWSA